MLYSLFRLALSFFILMPTLSFGRENFSWNNPKSLAILGSPFVDVVLDVDLPFIKKCCLEVGGAYPAESSKIKDIFSLYEELFPEAQIVARRKEPLNLSQDQLSSLGLACKRNNEISMKEYVFSGNGPALQQLDQIRLVLHCPSHADTLIYSSQEAKAFSQKKLFSETLSSEGYTLIDGQLILYSDCMEKILREAQSKHTKVFLDLGDLQIITMFQSRLWSLLNYVDVLFISENSQKAFAGIPNLTAASRFLSRIVPTLFVYGDNSIQIIQKEQKVLYSYNNEFLPQLISGFLFGYMNQGSLEYCLHCALSLSEEV